MKPIKLKYIINEILSELDIERFSDMKGVCIPAEKFVEMLNTELERLKVPRRYREKRPVTDPIITKGMINKAKDGPEEEIDIQNIIKQITTLPKSIFDVGPKSEHSVTEYSETINTGIPAFRGILWNEDKKEFFILNTCPGAGTCVKPCYALHGFYAMNDGKVRKLANRLQLLVSDPGEYEDMAFSEAKRAAASANASDKLLYIRWNDAGDFFDKAYLDIAISVTKRLKARGFNVQSYAYTKVASAFRKGEENDVVMNFSSGANSEQKKQLGDIIRNIKLSEVVPKDLHKNFFNIVKGKIAHEPGKKPPFKNEEAKIGLKREIYEKYKDHPEAGGFSFESLKYTDELPPKQGEKNQFNVIVLPYGDSDVGSQRRDVRVSFLCEH